MDDDGMDLPSTSDTENANSRGISQQWRKHEDEELLQLIAKHGAKRWSYIASLMPGGRRGKQCRDRYLNHLRPGIVIGEWTTEEEQILVEGHKALGTKWAALAKLLPGRPENAIKNHWHATMRCKWTKLAATEPWKLTVLQKYQMFLRGDDPNAFSDAGHENASDANGAEATKFENPSAVGMSRSAQNSRYSRAQREEIEEGFKRIGERLAEAKETSEVGAEKSGADVPTRSDALTHAGAGPISSLEVLEYNHPSDVPAASGKSDEGTTFSVGGLERSQVRSPVGPFFVPTEGDVVPPQARSSITSKPAPVDFIRVCDDLIDIGQCQAAVSALGASEVSMLSSVSASDCVAYERTDTERIAKGLRDIAAVTRARWSLSRVALVVRTGPLARGDCKLCVAVAADNSHDVMNAAEFASYLIKNERWTLREDAFADFANRGLPSTV